jgi:N-acetylglucosaminyldiphosphoundecaprenol N-acetyl-beta-D-mannosaminyltransferase
LNVQHQTLNVDEGKFTIQTPGGKVNSNKVVIAGVAIDNVSMDEALFLIEERIRQREPSFMVTPNVDHIVKLQKDPEFRRIYEEAASALPDGMPLLWAGRLLKTPLKEKISGSDLVPRLCERAACEGYRLFFLGGRPGAARQAKARLEEKFPSIQIVGTHSPPMGFERDAEENKKIEELIKGVCPDILLVGLGAPKQEKWIHNHYKRLQVPVSVGVGVSFEFMAGMVKRAPQWMQRAGLEWFWRLMMEPGRLWKRYLIDDMQFFRLILMQKAGWV